MTKIEWADETINPVKVKGGGWHCTKVSPGCAHCYSERINRRFGNGKPYDDSPTEYILDQKALDKVFSWKKPKRIFIQSMGDTFHDEFMRMDVETDVIKQLFIAMMRANWHTYYILTKRPENMKKFFDSWTPQDIFVNEPKRDHIWLGVSISNNDDLWMVDKLLQVQAANHWVSVEPMLGPVALGDNLYKYFCVSCGWKGNELHTEMLGSATRFTVFQFCPKCLTKIKETEGGKIIEPPSIDWIVCGAETGPGARPMDLAWPRDLRDQCRVSGVPFFMKQVSGKQPMPTDLQIREFPLDNSTQI